MKHIYQIFAVIVLLGISGCTSVAVPTATVEAPTATFVPPPTMGAVTEIPDALSLTFDQKFEETVCPGGSAAGALCLLVSGTAKDAVLGDVTLSRIAVLDVAGKKDENQCVPAFTHGTLKLGADSVTYNAMGKYCPDASTATYIYIITQGTGAYTNADGTGNITVPAPSGSGTGTEIWSGTLQ